MATVRDRCLVVAYPRCLVEWYHKKGGCLLSSICVIHATMFALFKLFKLPGALILQMFIFLAIETKQCFVLESFFNMGFVARWMLSKGVRYDKV